MRPFLALLFVPLALPAASAVAAPAKEITLQRVESKTPHPAAPAIAAAWAGRPLGLSVRDARPDEASGVLGAQQEKGVLLYEWKTTQPVADVVRAMVEETLRSWKISVVPEATPRLELVLQTLRIDEVPETFGSTYRGEVGLRGAIFDPERSASTSPRSVSGLAKRSGPDRRPKLCNEALTGALEDALAKLLQPPAEEAPAAATLTTAPADPNAVQPKTMLQELVRLKEAGVGEPVLLGYVRQRRLATPLSADDILKWKESGLPESVIQAAQEIK
jgi:hypothetical protein